MISIFVISNPISTAINYHQILIEMFYTFIPSRHVNIPCDANILILVSLMTSFIAVRERERERERESYFNSFENVGMREY